MTSGEVSETHVAAENDADGSATAWRAWPAALVAAGGALVLYALLPLVAIGANWGLVNYDESELMLAIDANHS